MKQLLLCLLFVVIPMASASDFSGTWRGQLNLGQGVSIVLGFDISHNEDGEVNVLIDSPNQGMHDFPASSAAIKNNQLTIQSDELDAQFSGQLNNQKLSGEWKQGQAMPIELSRLASNDEQRMRFEGTYKGTLDINANTSLPLQLNIAVLANGYLATLDSPAQESFGIPVDQVNIDDTQLTFQASMIGASYSGILTESESSQCYKGQFSQGGKLPLTLCIKATEQTSSTQQVNPADYNVDGAVITYSNGQWQVERFTHHVPKDAQFEIGSVTKTMVAFLLAEDLANESLAQDTQLAEVWDKLPKPIGDISLVSLATHFSGLPRLPANLDVTDDTNPYADYHLNQLSDALRNTELSSPKGYQYSNFGYSVLAETLVAFHHQSLDTLLTQSLFKPLNMNHSYLALENEDHVKAHINALAQGHRFYGDTTSHWYFDAMAGAGAVVSTVDDMVSYIKLMMQPPESQKDTVETVLEPRESLSTQTQQALGWLIQNKGQQRWAWHNGQTAGFTSYVGFTLDGHRGVVLLSNQARPVTQLGQQLLLTPVK